MLCAPSETLALDLTRTPEFASSSGSTAGVSRMDAAASLRRLVLPCKSKNATEVCNSSESRDGSPGANLKANNVPVAAFTEATSEALAEAERARARTKLLETSFSIEKRMEEILTRRGRHSALQALQAADTEPSSRTNAYVTGKAVSAPHSPASVPGPRAAA